MPENILKLKKSAVDAGMDREEARTADRETLEAFLAKASKKSSKKNSSKSGGKKKSGKKVAKKSAETSTETPAKKKSAKKQTAGKAKRSPSAAPAEKAKPAAKKNSSKPAAKPKAKPKASSNSSGREVIGRLNYKGDFSEDWNPRAGSPVERIWKLLKKYNDNVERVYEELKPHAKEFASSTTAPDGTRRTKQWLENNLHYRILRTRFEFGRKTGQHESSKNRVQYGTGPYAEARKKADAKQKREARKAERGGTSTKKSSAKKSSKKAKK